MVWPVRPAQAGLPQDRCEDDHRQEKEDAGDFKPQNSAHAAEGTQETADAAGDATRGLTGYLAGGAGLGCTGAGGGCRLAGNGPGAGGDALAGDAASDAQADAEGPADGLRFHFDLMVTAWVPARRATDCGSSELISGGVGSKV